MPMNFALILFLLTAVTGVAWLVDKLVLEGRVAIAACRTRQLRSTAQCDHGRGDRPLAHRQEVENAALREPSWVEYSKASSRCC